MIKIALVSLLYVVFVGLASGQKNVSKPTPGDCVRSEVSERL